MQELFSFSGLNLMFVSQFCVCGKASFPFSKKVIYGFSDALFCPICRCILLFQLYVANMFIHSKNQVH